ncbi:fungal-specific transcription factor domain-containing protein [Xylariales sp. PMI_506]|nr:fungal-specific transcription factor domain-containing protein [Xylariales sp. PMI_506]
MDPAVPQILAAYGADEDGVGDDDNVSPIEVRACKQCRARKVRCDRKPELCGACSRLGLACSFGSSSEAPDGNAHSSPSDQPQLTEAGFKRRRVKLACSQCRLYKARCSGSRPCERCMSRRVRCQWSEEKEPQSHPSSNQQHPDQVTRSSDATERVPGMGSVVIPDKAAVKRCLEAYFDNINPTTCVFLHRPTTFADWSRDKLSPVQTLMLCALGMNLSHESPEHARMLAEEAQSILLSHVGKQTIAQVQGLVLLVQFHFLLNNMTEAWNIIALAARVAFVLRLNYEHPQLPPVTQETQRRLMWAIYQLDRIMSGGVEDLAICPVHRMHIRLPCTDHSFLRGLPSQASYLNSEAEDGRADPYTMDILGYHIKLNAIRDRVLGYTKRVRREGSSPATSRNELEALDADLMNFAEFLPTHLKLDPETLLLMAHTTEVEPYIMIHTRWILSKCDLFRFLVPGIREAVPMSAFENTPADYIHYCQQAGLESALRLCDFWAQIRSLDIQWPARDVFSLSAIISIYQAAQIIHHLSSMLPREGPHSVDEIRKSLHRIIETDDNFGSKTHPLIKRCLEDTKRLLATFGQRQMWPGPSPGEDQFNPHLPSLHTLIPVPYEQADNDAENSPLPSGFAGILRHSPRLTGRATLDPAITNTQGPDSTIQLPNDAYMPTSEGMSMPFDNNVGLGYLNVFDHNVDISYQVDYGDLVGTWNSQT